MKLIKHRSWDTNHLVSTVVFREWMRHEWENVCVMQEHLLHLEDIECE